MGLLLSIASSVSVVIPLRLHYFDTLAGRDVCCFTRSFFGGSVSVLSVWIRAVQSRACRPKLAHHEVRFGRTQRKHINKYSKAASSTENDGQLFLRETKKW